VFSEIYKAGDVEGIQMTEKEFLCPKCSMEDKKNVMIYRHDMLECPECKTSFFLKEKSPLERYIGNWKKNAEEMYPLVRPELRQPDLPVPRLFFLYEDCYHTLLIGKYNASIVLMGVLLEAIMKERIKLRLGLDFRKPFGACLKVMMREGLMDAKDIKFLKRFKNEIRNPYTHADDKQIVEGIFVPVWELSIEEIHPEKFTEVLKNIKSGKRKPRIFPATFLPLRAIIKQEYDRRRATHLFNQVYDFLISAQIKYFKQEEYELFHKKFGSKPEAF